MSVAFVSLVAGRKAVVLLRGVVQFQVEARRAQSLFYARSPFSHLLKSIGAFERRL